MKKEVHSLDDQILYPFKLGSQFLIWKYSETWLCSGSVYKIDFESSTPGPHLMRIHLVRYSTSARYGKYSIIHLVRPIIHLVRIFALSTSWIN